MVREYYSNDWEDARDDMIQERNKRKISRCGGLSCVTMNRI